MPIVRSPDQILIHTLKTWPEFFALIEAGEKLYELRRNDRGFQLGDSVHLREFDRKRDLYTGRVIIVEVTRVLSFVPGLDPDFVILHFKITETRNGSAVPWCPHGYGNDFEGCTICWERSPA